MVLNRLDGTLLIWLTPGTSKVVNLAMVNRTSIEIVVFPGAIGWSDISLQVLHHCNATINSEYLTGYIRGLVGSQECNRISDLLGFSLPAEGYHG